MNRLSLRNAINKAPLAHQGLAERLLEEQEKKTALRSKVKKQRLLTEREEPRMADVRAPCTARSPPLRAPCRCHAMPLPRRRPPALLRPRFRDRPRSSRPTRSCVTSRPRRSRATSSSPRASMPAWISSRSSATWPMSLTRTVRSRCRRGSGGASSGRRERLDPLEVAASRPAPPAPPRVSAGSVHRARRHASYARQRVA